MANYSDIRYKRPSMGLKKGNKDITEIKSDNDDLIIETKISDKDIHFKGSDDGSVITALTLDMSDGGSASFNHNVTVGGNLTVNGTTTTVNSTTLTVDDKNIELGSTASPSDTSADGGGITLKGATDHTFNWVNSTDAWTSSEHINLASGKEFKINGTSLKDVSETLTNKTIDASSNTITGISSDLVNDTTPQLGGNLDANSNNITNLGTLNTHTIPGGTGTFALTSDLTFTTSSTDTLTNKTINTASNTITIVEADISDLGSYITASSTDTLTNKSGNISMFTNNSGYITASSTNTLTNKSGNISQWTNNSGYLTSITAGTGIDVSGTTISIEADLREGGSGSDRYWGNSHDYIFADASHGLRFYTAGAEEMRLENDGDLHVDGDVIAFSTTVSDIALKSDIEVIPNALDKVNEIRGVTFTRHDGRTGAGIIAQELEKVLPQAVKEKLLPLQKDDNKKYKTVEYDSIHGLLIEAIKELSKKVEQLEKDKT